MKELDLENVYNKCLLDDEDYDFFKYINCYVSNKQGYVCYSIGKENFPIHRTIMKLQDKNLFIDHIDGNTFNNKKSNLRICTKAENCRNTKVNKNNTSGHKGVGFI